MPGTALSLDDEFWYRILSFLTDLPLEAFNSSRINKKFLKAFNALIKERGNPEFWNFSEYLPFALGQEFWNGFKCHYPFWNKSLNDSGDVFVSHIFESLKNSEFDEARTDQVLLYLAKTKSFEKDRQFNVRINDHLASLSHFVINNITNPRLYAYLEVKKGNASVPINSSSFSEWINEFFGTDIDNVHWILNKFISNFPFLFWLSRNDHSGRLLKRLQRLHLLQDAPDDYLDSAITRYFFYGGLVVLSLYLVEYFPKEVKDSLIMKYYSLACLVLGMILMVMKSLVFWIPFCSHNWLQRTAFACEKLEFYLESFMQKQY